MTFPDKLTELLEKAAKGPCNPYVIKPQSATDNFYEPYSPWVSGGFPKPVQVGRGLCISADDMALIAYLFNHAEAIRDLVVAAENICEIYNGMEGFVAETAPEAYQQRIIQQMYQEAISARAKLEEA